MKKIFGILAVVVVLVTMLTACGKFECELCGKEKSGKKYKEEVLGKEAIVCEECKEGLDKINDGLDQIGNLFK